jgi:hypothetical protein
MEARLPMVVFRLAPLPEEHMPRLPPRLRTSRTLLLADLPSISTVREVTRGLRMRQIPWELADLAPVVGMEMGTRLHQVLRTLASIPP